MTGFPSITCGKQDYLTGELLSINNDILTSQSVFDLNDCSGYFTIKLHIERILCLQNIQLTTMMQQEKLSEFLWYFSQLSLEALHFNDYDI